MDFVLYRLDRWPKHTKVWPSRLPKQQPQIRKSMCLWSLWIPLHDFAVKDRFPLKNSKNIGKNSTNVQSKSLINCFCDKCFHWIQIYFLFLFFTFKMNRYVVINMTRPTPDLKIPATDAMKGFFEICGFNQDTPKILNALANHCFT